MFTGKYTKSPSKFTSVVIVAASEEETWVTGGGGGGKTCSSLSIPYFDLSVFTLCEGEEGFFAGGGEGVLSNHTTYASAHLCFPARWALDLGKTRSKREKE